ncbi:MAG: rRNA maturation RNase YbeY [Sneathiella sp.]
MPDRSTLNQIVSASLNHILSELDLDAPPASPGIEISFLFSDDTHIQKLNKEYRQKDSPTNVLSFPQAELSTQTLQETLLFEEPLLLGDIALAEETIKREAAEQNKSFHNHLAHLVIHGVLHLVGYDHIEEDEAEHMESIEVEILKKLDIGNPYTIAHNAQEASQSTK